VAHELDRVLVTQVVATLDRVERVPLGMVLFEVAQRRADAALRGARVRACGIELRQDRGAEISVARQVQGGHEARTAAAHDERVVVVYLVHRSAAPAAVRGKVKMM